MIRARQRQPDERFEAKWDVPAEGRPRVSIVLKEPTAPESERRVSWWIHIACSSVAVLTWAILFFVVPSFERMYRETRLDTPLETQVLFALSGFATHVLGTIAWAGVVVAGNVLLARRAKRRHEGWIELGLLVATTAFIVFALIALMPRVVILQKL